MNVTQYSNENQILASGSFILREKEDNLKLHIDMRPELNYDMNVKLTFSKERDCDEARVEVGYG